MLRFVSMVHESPAEEVRTRLAEASIDASPTTPEEFAAFIRAETERWAKVLKDANIPKQ